MDEAEWLACEEPVKMLRRARFRSSKRKSRLFAVACCRPIWPALIERNDLADLLARAVLVAGFHQHKCGE
jgi:hypothetical protein